MMDGEINPGFQWCSTDWCLSQWFLFVTIVDPTRFKFLHVRFINIPRKSICLPLVVWNKISLFFVIVNLDVCSKYLPYTILQYMNLLIKIGEHKVNIIELNNISIKLINKSWNVFWFFVTWLGDAIILSVDLLLI